jgi:DNA-binding transcriptional LysR family regulator
MRSEERGGPDGRPEFEIGLYWHDRFHRDPANKWLRDLVVQELATGTAAGL